MFDCIQDPWSVPSSTPGMPSCIGRSCAPAVSRSCLQSHKQAPRHVIIPSDTGPCHQAGARCSQYTSVTQCCNLIGDTSHARHPQLRTGLEGTAATLISLMTTSGRGLSLLQDRPSTVLSSSIPAASMTLPNTTLLPSSHLRGFRVCVCDQARMCKQVAHASTAVQGTPVIGCDVWLL